MIKTGSLTPTGEEIRAESMSLNLSERDSTATVTESADLPDRATGAWVLDSAGRVWRIRSVELDPVRRTRTIQMETILKTLQDRIIPTEITGADMGGSSSGCTATQAVRKILSYQSDWKLGTNEYSHSEPYQFNGDDLLAALETVSGTLEDCFWDISTASYPFTISFRKVSWEPTCEMRMSRNIQTLKRTIDRSKMYTVFYPVGADDRRIGAVRKNTDLYGVREATATDAEMDTDAKLRAWANRMLRRHAQPAVSVSISGMDLSQATGEPLDRLRIGTVCRVPLPEYNTTIAERITRISYSDVIRDPEKITVTMANELADTKSLRSMSEAVSASSASAARGGRSRAKKDKEDNAWFVDTKDKVGMVAQAVAGPGADKNWSRVSELYVDGKGIHGRVTETEKGVVSAMSWIEANAEKVRLGVKKGEVATQLVIEAGNCHLENGDLIVDGLVTAAAVQTAVANISDLTVGGTVRARNYYLGTGAVPVSMGAGVYDIRITQSGNNYTLQKQTFNNSSWVNVRTFSRAVTSMDGVWSGGVLTVTPKPQGSPKYVTQITKGQQSVVSDKTIAVSILASYGSQQQYTQEIRNFNVDASEVYDAAYKVTQSQVSGSNAHTIPTSAGSSVISGKRSVGSCARPTVASYLIFTLSIHGESHDYYITLN